MEAAPPGPGAPPRGVAQPAANESQYDRDIFTDYYSDPLPEPD